MPVINWTTYVPATEVSNFRSTYLELPAFSIDSGIEWKGASEVVRQYNYSAAKDFVLLRRPTKPAGVNFGLCVRYRVGDQVTRYKLWTDARFVLNDDEAPLYVGQRIRANFVLEIWSFNALTEAELSEALQMTTSIRNEITTLGTRGAESLATGAAFNTLANVQSPTIVANRSFWYDINDPAVMYVSPLDAWYDRDTGFNTNPLESSIPDPSTRPTIVTGSAQINGKNYVFFDGVDDLLYGARAFQFPVTVYAYMKVDNITSFDTFISLRSATTQGTVWGVDANTIAGQYNGQSANADVVVDTWMMVVLQIEAGQKVKLKLGNSAVVESAGVPALDPQITSLNLGGNPLGPSNWGEMGIAEIVGYNAAHGEAEYLQMLQYFEAKYQGGMVLPISFNAGGPWLSNDPL